MKPYCTLFILTILFLSCGDKAVVKEVPMKDFKDLTLDEFMKKSQTDPKAFIIDVRTPGETRAGMFKGAIRINSTSQGFLPRILKLDRHKHYYVYCHSGGRSAKASRIMIDNGFVCWLSLFLPIRKLPPPAELLPSLVRIDCISNFFSRALSV